MLLYFIKIIFFVSLQENLTRYQKSVVPDSRSLHWLAKTIERIGFDAKMKPGGHLEKKSYQLPYKEFGGCGMNYMKKISPNEVLS